MAGIIDFPQVPADIGEMRVVSADGRIVLECESSGIAVIVADAYPSGASEPG